MIYDLPHRRQAIRRFFSAFVAIFYCGIWGLGCGNSTPSAPADAEASDRAPIVIVSIDTLRSDRLSVYGSEIASPEIADFRDDAVLFERAYTTYPLTLPAHASLFTGLLPAEHGVRDNAGYPYDAAALPHLPRRLAEHGYRTGAAISAWVLRGAVGLADGFEFYDDDLGRPGMNDASGRRPGRETIRRGLDWLAEVRAEDADAPFFLFLHLYEPHTPWEAPEPFASQYAHPYDAEIAYSDALFGEIVDELRRLGVYDDSLVVLLSDHGEGLGDHGEEEHGLLLYREAVQIPLLLKPPRGRTLGDLGPGASVAAPVQITDVMSTLAWFAGLDDTPLLIDPEPDRALWSETFYPRLQMGWSELGSVVAGDLHYLDGPRPELYDLSVDPGETNDLLAVRRGDAARLRDLAEGFSSPLEAPQEVDPETARRLADLGYLAGGSDAASSANPRDEIEVFERLRDAIREMNSGDPVLAEQSLRSLCEEHPETPAAWVQLAAVLEILGRPEEALEAWQEALRLGTGADAALGAASVLLRLNRPREAAEHAELALKSDPPRARLLRARAALAQGRTDAAENDAQVVLASGSETIEARFLLAHVAATREDFQETLAHIDQAEQAQARRTDGRAPVGLYLLKGQILARLDRAEEAAEALRREIESHPQEPHAYSLLASVYGFLGRAEEATEVIEDFVATIDSPDSWDLAVRTLLRIRRPDEARELLRRGLEAHPQDAELRQLDAFAREAAQRP